MNNPFFVLTDDDNQNQVIAIIRNEPLEAPPGEEEDQDYLKDRIRLAVKSQYDCDPTLITIPEEWKEMHKPIPILVDFLNEMNREETLGLTLTMAWDY